MIGRPLNLDVATAEPVKGVRAPSLSAGQRRRSRRMGLPCLVAAVSCLLVAGRAEAQPTNAAEGPSRYFERGARDYQAGQFEEAIAEFEEAYKIAPDPILLFNIAQSNRHLGRKERALFFYR